MTDHTDLRIDAGPLAVDAVDADVTAEDDTLEDTGRLIRPYAMTGGRTTAETDIDLEAQIQVSTRFGEQPLAYRWEAAKLIELVQAPMALIEIAARLQIPVGVARVLVADLMADGAVVLHTPPPATQNYGSLLERVLDGVRNL